MKESTRVAQRAAEERYRRSRGRIEIKATPGGKAALQEYVQEKGGGMSVQAYIVGLIKKDSGLDIMS